MEEINDLTQTSSLFSPDFARKGKIRHIPVKRGFDILFSLIVLTVGAPLFLLIAASISLASSGMPLYAQERIGRGGKIFRCYKFRTMYPDADKKLREILRNDPDLLKEWNQTFKLKNDPRITPVGRYLRKTSLDELPQFWNVLKGDLSVVGPRPVVREELEKYFGVKAYKILSIRPGLTGLWQISGRSDISCYQKRIRLDESYIDNHSFLSDIKIILKTIPAMISKKGAY